MRLLAVHARSAADLRGRLRGAGFADDVVADVIAGLTSAGLVDDLEFAKSWIAGRQAAGGIGKQRLRWELRRKGVASDLIDRVIAEEVREDTEAEQALLLAQKRLKGNDAKALARVRRLLVSRGFGFDIVDAVMRRMSSGIDRDSDLQS